MAAAHGSYPWLPVELIERIIRQLWAAALPCDERVHLLLALPLVNTAWRGAFARISARDVHIPTPAYARDFLWRILQGKRSGAGAHKLQHAEDTLLCHRLTLWVHDRGCYPRAAKLLSDWRTDGPTQTSTANAVDTGSTFLYFAHRSSQFVNLTHVVLQFVDWAFDGLSAYPPLLALPPQVKHLSIAFSCSTSRALQVSSASPFTSYAQNGVPLHSSSGPRRRQTRGCTFVGWHTAHIQALTVSGSPPAGLVEDLVRACPALRALDADCGIGLWSVLWDLLGALSQSVRSVVLRGVRVGGGSGGDNGEGGAAGEWLGVNEVLALAKSQGWRRTLCGSPPGEGMSLVIDPRNEHERRGTSQGTAASSKGMREVLGSGWVRIREDCVGGELELVFRSG